jgi:hypothetical protein
MKELIFALAFTLPLFAFSQNSSLQTITIEPYLSFQNYEHFKRLVLNSNDSQAEYIEGFEFEWGFKYQLKVKVTEMIPELSDGTQYEFALDQLISKIKIIDSTEFKLLIDPLIYYNDSEVADGGMNHSLKSLNDSTYLYFDLVEIEVPEILKDKFRKIAFGKTGRVGKFIFINKKRIRLVSL